MARSVVNVTGRMRSTSYPAPGADGTISFWLKPAFNHNNNQQRWFFQFGLNSAATQFHMYKHSDNNLICGWYVSSVDYRINSASDSSMFTSGTWAHHLVTWSDSGDTTTYYLNGTQKFTRTTSVATASITNQMSVACGSSEISVSADGSFDEFAMWSSILSADEIAALASFANPASVCTPNLMLNFHLDSANESASEKCYVSGTSLTVANCGRADGAPIATAYYDNYSDSYTNPAGSQPYIRRLGGSVLPTGAGRLGVGW